MATPNFIVDNDGFRDGHASSNQPSDAAIFGNRMSSIDNTFEQSGADRLRLIPDDFAVGIDCIENSGVFSDDSSEHIVSDRRRAMMPAVSTVEGANGFPNELTDDSLSLHCHSRPKQRVDRSAQRTLCTASVVTAVFVGAQFTACSASGGYLADSLAIMTDAGHLLTDLLGFIISLIAIAVARRPATKLLSFGYYRAEVLGAMISILIIWVLTGILVYLAVRRTITNDFKINADIMMITAGASLVFNIVMGAILHFGGGGHHHSHGGRGHSHGAAAHQDRAEDTAERGHANPALTDHTPSSPDSGTSLDDTENSSTSDDLSPTSCRRWSVTAYPEAAGDAPPVATKRRRPRDQRNINVRAAFIHVVGDLVQSVGVLLAAVLIKFEPEWRLADPICTFFFSALVLLTTTTVLRDAIAVLMEGTPRDVSFDDIRRDLLNIGGVRAVHNLHLWSLTMDKAALAVHLAIDPTVDAVSVMRLANKLIRQEYNVQFATIQVEPYDASVMNNCEECTGPKT